VTLGRAEPQTRDAAPKRAYQRTMSIHRRDLLVRGAVGGAALLAATALVEAAPPAKPMPPVPAPKGKVPPGLGKHAPAPLPFKPGGLTGISEKMITSHHDKNYAGAVKNLNKVETDLAALKADAPGYVVAGLREKELTYGNSMVLHEHYFGNLGGNGKRSGALETRLGTDFGAGVWEAQVRAAATALGGGSGWVLVSLSLHDGGLRISSSTNHTQAVAFGAPLLALDMYEHAYALDYGADHAPYIDAVFKNLAWEVVEARYDRAMKALAALG
jgi:Fe-Mn family superoxide dismutase